MFKKQMNYEKNQLKHFSIATIVIEMQAYIENKSSWTRLVLRLAYTLQNQ